jgi:23S rRNA (adenine2030-N6)-methyltransferase
VSPAGSRYRPEAAPDYSHRFHAGNVGDVWKHCVLVEVLRRAATTAARVSYVETHAGEGRYSLGATGEWTEGIGRLWAGVDPTAADDAVTRYVALCRRLGAGDARPARYPGSPVLARAVLGPQALLALWERDARAFARLGEETRGEVHTRLVEGDGLEGLGEELRTAESRPDAVVALVDPPYNQKRDWTLVPDALAAALAGSSRACVMLWYPVKSHTRPNAMIARLRAARVPATVAEIVTTPLDQRRQRLNGSAVLLVRPPAGALETLAAAAPAIGRRCATVAGAWSFSLLAWP